MKEKTDLIKELVTAKNLPESTDRFSRMEKHEKLALIKAMKDINDEGLGAFLNSVHEMETEKEVKKEIRRLLFILKTKGIKIEEPRPTEPPLVRKKEDGGIHRAFLSNYDYRLNRIVQCVYRLNKDSYLYINGLTHFSDGLEELFTGLLKKGDVESTLEENKNSIPQGLELTEISPAYGLYVLQEASSISGRKKGDIEAIKRRLGNIPSGVRRPEDIYHLEIPDSIYPYPLRKILEQDIFAPFFLKWSHLEEDEKEYNGTGASTLLLPPYMVEEKREGIVKRVMGYGEIQSRSSFFKRMLEDYAYLFYMRRDLSLYKGLIDTLSKEGGIEEGIEFFIRKSLSKTGGEKQGIIVSPYG
ncbi:MAG: hypothetical protein N2745_09165 [Syntrophorhabdaceae bacterium]|nr:hypothetical protein [Syntrophorhabdaceae bacterium]